MDQHALVSVSENEPVGGGVYFDEIQHGFLEGDLQHQSWSAAAAREYIYCEPRNRAAQSQKAHFWVGRPAVEALSDFGWLAQSRILAEEQCSGPIGNRL
jgi:hypothetical protein